MKIGSLFISTALCAGLLSGGFAMAETEDAAQIERGKQVYEAQRCRLCHSIEGVGNTRSPLDGVGSRLSEDDARKWIIAPREMDPTVRKRAYKLSRDDLEALVAYMMSLE